MIPPAENEGCVCRAQTEKLVPRVRRHSFPKMTSAFGHFTQQPQSNRPAGFRVTGAHLAELYANAARVWGDMPAFATRRQALEWEPTGFRELYNRGCFLATALIDLGVEPRDHVGLLGDNRLEWILADYGVQLCGAADVPRGRDVTDGEIAFIFRHAGIRTAFVETETLQDRLLRLRGKLPELREVILLDPRAKPAEGVRRLSGLIETGRRLRDAGDRRVEERVAQISPDDLFTLIYTSGTTGEPKGVMLTHANMISQLERIPLEVTCTDRVVSILPVWHIFERVFEMLAVSRGCCTFYSSVRTLSDDMRNIEPTFMGSAPRLWESIHQKILKRVKEAHPVRRGLFHTAYFLSHYYKESVFFLTGRSLDLKGRGRIRTAVLGIIHAVRWALLLPWYGFFNAAVLEKLRLVVGGAFKGSVSGGGALPREVDQFFNYLGIPVLEGYGLTETSPVIAVRTPSKLVIGTVGPVIPDTEIRIVSLDTEKILYPDRSRDDLGRGLKGEILVRGPQIMKGYYRNSEATKAALAEGWLRTGDIGIITFNDCLKIVGRCKETIVLSSGENLEPAPIEMRLNQSALIDQCMVVGQDRKYPGVLIVPSLEGFSELGISMNHRSELNGRKEVRQRIAAEIRERISHKEGFKVHERLHAFGLLPEPFTTDEELTTLFKLKRHVVTEKYRAEIDAMYHRAEAER